jgi:hypothetical protein
MLEQPGILLAGLSLQLRHLFTQRINPGINCRPQGDRLANLVAELGHLNVTLSTYSPC